MGRGRDWEKAAGRDRMRSHGAESVDGMTEAEFVHSYHTPLGKKPPRISKATARRELENAMASAGGVPIERILRCPCGHRGVVRLPPEQMKRKFVCSKCGRRIG